MTVHNGGEAPPLLALRAQHAIQLASLSLTKYTGIPQIASYPRACDGRDKTYRTITRFPPPRAFR